MASPKSNGDQKDVRAVVDKGRRGKWWRRRGSKSRGFYYIDHDGKRVTKADAIERINSLAIPPAWQHIRICPSSGGRLQAVGVDAAGRVQYLYHPAFARRQQRKKFARIEEFGEYLPRLRKTTNEHIVLAGFPRDKVLAVIVRLINSLYFRVGAEQSARQFRTYGVTTLKNDHLKIGLDGTLRFNFVGKSRILHRKILVDAELAEVMRELRKIGVKRKLFNYLDEEGKPRPVKAADINRYLKDATSAKFSAKDFRTWGATLLAAIELADAGPAEDESSRKTKIVEAVKNVARELGNTPAVCRGSYIHPVVFDAYEKGLTLNDVRPRRSRSIKRIQDDLEPEEKALIRLFESRRNGG